VSTAFAPRQPDGMAAGAAISLAAHLVLLAALALAVQWRLPAPQPVSAELWSATPQQAAPPAPAEPAAVPAPPVSTAIAPAPPARPAASPEAAAATAAQAALAEAARVQQAARQAEIAREREAKRLAEEQQAARERAAQEKAARAERLRQERERTAQQQQQQKAEQAEKARLQKAEQQKAEQQKAEEARLARQREENLRRLMGQIPAGSGTAAGTAAADAAPSASYAGRLVQAIFPNIVFTDTLPGNPAAVVEVRAGPNGTVIGRRLVSSSGHREWDEAVLRAIDRTGTLPRDVDGRVPPVIEITFRPR
jgi:colicin import membrane protein